MRQLKQALQDHELIVLRVIGEWWELDLTGADKDGSVKELTHTLERLNLKMELEQSMPEEASALKALIANNGRMPVATFARDHGDVRMMGPGKLEREEPWFDPQNAAEALWYRGLLYRGFDDTPEGLIEFYFLPDEFYSQFHTLPPKPTTAGKKSAKPAPPKAVEQEEEIEELEYEDESLFEEVPEFDEDAIVVDEDESAATEKKEDLFEEDDLSYLQEPQYVDLDASGQEAKPDPKPERRAKKADVSGLTAVSPPKSIPHGTTNPVDDLTSILIMAQKIGLDSNTSKELDKYLISKDPDRRSLLINLALEMEMVRQTPNGLRTTRAAVDWLQQSREQQLREIADAWSSSQWNELRHTPQLQCEGDGWENDPILARNGVLETLPRNIQWYRIQDFIQLVKTKAPDFQRPDGNYDTWYIRDLGTKQYISGFENWELVEGRLITFILNGPLTWLGLIITAETPDGLCFSVTDRLLEWLREAPPAKDEMRVPLLIKPEGIIAVSSTADRYHRFQAARITDPLPIDSDKEFLYRITPDALTKAQHQGITPDRVVQFLETASGRPLPAGVKRAIDRWSENGIEGKLETVVVLRVRDADILQTLRTNPKTRDFIGESLGDLAAAVKPDHRDQLHSAVVQLGLLLDVVL